MLCIFGIFFGIGSSTPILHRRRSRVSPSSTWWTWKKCPISIRCTSRLAYHWVAVSHGANPDSKRSAILVCEEEMCPAATKMSHEDSWMHHEYHPRMTTGIEYNWNTISIPLRMSDSPCSLVGEVSAFSPIAIHQICPSLFGVEPRLYDPVTVMFFFRNKHMMIDLGTGAEMTETSVCLLGLKLNSQGKTTAAVIRSFLQSL